MSTMKTWPGRRGVLVARHSSVLLFPYALKSAVTAWLRQAQPLLYTHGGQQRRIVVAALASATPAAPRSMQKSYIYPLVTNELCFAFQSCSRAQGTLPIGVN